MIEGEVRRAGFTAVEMMIYLLVATVVIGSSYKLLVAASRNYQRQREQLDARESLRTAALLLAWDLRELSATGGDIYRMDSTSITIRAFMGTAVICGEHPTDKRYGLWGASGDWDTTPNDSALIYATGNPGPDDDRWLVVRLRRRWDRPAKAAVPYCFWGDSLAGKGRGTGKGIGVTTWNGNVEPDFAMQFEGDVEAVYIGSPVRAFRKVEYSLISYDGRFWLGRREGTAATFDRIAGPLRSRSEGGLVLTYVDGTGSATTDPTAVESIDIIIRAESYQRARPRAGVIPALQQDSLSTRVYLRG